MAFKKLPGWAGKVISGAADISGATSVVRVGGNLAQNISRSIQGKPVKPLYKKGEYGKLAKDIIGIGALGATTLGAVSGLASSAPVKKVLDTEGIKSGSTMTGIDKAWAKLKDSEKVAERGFKKFLEVKSKIPK